MARRRPKARSGRRQQAAPLDPKVLLVLLLVLGAIWLYQEGYIQRWLAQLRPADSAEQAAADAPESIQGDQPQAAAAPEPTIAQPPAASAAAPDAQRTVETQALRGAEGPWYQVYFTKPAYPEGPANRTQGIDETIAADIGRAQRSVEVAAFDFDLVSIARALAQAKQRGVAVRVSIDGENLEDPAVASLMGELEALGIPVFYDQRAPFMHDKIVVIDENIVWLGSMNLTANDAYRNNNNMLRIASPELAANYLAKTEDIFTGNGGRKGGSVLVNPRLTFGSATVETRFAPDDPITDAIVERLAGARDRIDMMAFAFTSDPIGDALLAARDRGVAVRAVMESRNAKGTGSEFERLRGDGIDIHADGNCYIMHHKVIVIDGRTVITGSFNFTRGAQEQNDENVLIIDDPVLAARYLEEFERVYNQALEPTRCGR